MNSFYKCKSCCGLHKVTLTLLVIAQFFSSPVQAAKQNILVSELVFPAPQQITAPSAMAIDSARQRYYVVASNQGKLFSYDGNGTALTEFDAGGKLDQPTDMSFARPGKLWVVDREKNGLLYIDINSQKVREFSPKKANGNSMFIGRIATDLEHRLFVSDKSSGRLYALDDNLKIVTAFTPPSGGFFIDFKIKANTLWALEQRSQAVYQFNLQGKQLQKIPLNKTLHFPYSLAIDSKNNIYILDRSSAKIHQFTSSGKHVGEFGKKGSRRGQLSYPAQIMFDWQQRLCVVNQGNNRVEVFSLQQR